MKLFWRCLNGLCDDWENMESLRAGLDIAPDALAACLRRAVAEGLADAFDFKEGLGFVRHEGPPDPPEKLWFFITDKGRKALDPMPVEWFSAGESG